MRLRRCNSVCNVAGWNSSRLQAGRDYNLTWNNYALHLKLSLYIARYERQCKHIIASIIHFLLKCMLLLHLFWSIKHELDAIIKCELSFLKMAAAAAGWTFLPSVLSLNLYTSSYSGSYVLQHSLCCLVFNELYFFSFFASSSFSLSCVFFFYFISSSI